MRVTEAFNQIIAQHNRVDMTQVGQLVRAAHHENKENNGEGTAALKDVFEKNKRSFDIAAKAQLTAWLANPQ